MERRSQEEEQKLRLYIVYENHLYVEQLSKILSSLDELYNHLYIAQAPELALPLPLETRMRVEEIHTGQSIELLLSEGIKVIQEAGPVIQVLGPSGVVAAMVTLIFGYAKSSAEFRKTWYEGTKAKYEAEKARYEAERLKRELESEEIKKNLNRGNFDLSAVPDEEKQQASEAITKFFNLIEYTPNIVRVRVNEVVVLDKRPEIQSPESKNVQ